MAIKFRSILLIPYVWTDWPFLNLVKLAQQWGYADNHFPFDVSTLDANGWPTTISHGGAWMIFGIPSQAERPGKYVVKWDDGDRTTQIRAYVGSRVAIGKGANGRVLIAPAPSGDLTFNVQILVTGRPYVKNIRVCHENDEAELDAGQVFGTRFKQLMSKIGVIRFLDWQYSNNTNVSQMVRTKANNLLQLQSKSFSSRFNGGYDHKCRRCLFGDVERF